MRHGPDGIELAVYDQIGEILGVEVLHHDDGSTHGMFDAVLTYPDGSKAALEVTSNQSAEFMREYVENRRNGDWFGRLTWSGQLRRLARQCA